MDVGVSRLPAAARRRAGNPLAAFVNITGAGGPWTVQYSWFKGVYEDALNLLLNTAGSLRVRWNLFEAGGVGGHPDYLQSFGAGPMSVDVEFNMINHQAAGAEGQFGTQGFSCQDNPTNTRCTGISVRNIREYQDRGLLHPPRREGRCSSRPEPRWAAGPGRERGERGQASSYLRRSWAGIRNALESS